MNPAPTARQSTTLGRCQHWRPKLEVRSRRRQVAPSCARDETPRTRADHLGAWAPGLRFPSGAFADWPAMSLGPAVLLPTRQISGNWPDVLRCETDGPHGAGAWGMTRSGVLTSAVRSRAAIREGAGSDAGELERLDPPRPRPYPTMTTRVRFITPGSDASHVRPPEAGSPKNEFRRRLITPTEMPPKKNPAPVTYAKRLKKPIIPIR